MRMVDTWLGSMELYVANALEIPCQTVLSVIVTVFAKGLLVIHQT